MRLLLTALLALVGCSAQTFDNQKIVEVKVDSGPEAPPAPTQCDPMAPASWCGAGKACYFESAKKTVCGDGGTATGAGPGECSSDARACAPGFTCVGLSDCRTWCVTGSPCPTGQECRVPGTYFSDGRAYGWCEPSRDGG